MQKTDPEGGVRLHSDPGFTISVCVIKAEMFLNIVLL